MNFRLSGFPRSYARQTDGSIWIKCTKTDIDVAFYTNDKTNVYSWLINQQLIRCGGHVRKQG